MKIGIVAKLWEETTPYSRGGTGASVGTLVNGLVKKGHKVTLFATGDSKTKAQELISVRQKPYRGDYSEIHEYENVAEAFRRHSDFDIIYSAVEHKSVLFGELTSTPSLHSIRYGEFFDHEIKLLKKYKKLNFVANSKAIKRKLSFLNWQGVVYNGINLDLFPFNDKPRDYILFLARVSPQKGVDTAISIAEKLNKKLIIAGKLVEGDKDYLGKKVLPYIDGKKIVYAGEVKFREKIKLLKNALISIQPGLIFESCSNTIIESMACGTPVVCFNKGSNHELVKMTKQDLLSEKRTK